MLRRTTVIATVVLVAGSMLAGCGGNGSGGSGSDRRGGAAAPLQGTEWVLDQAASKLATRAKSVTVTAGFTADTLSGSSGCNRYTTGYRVDGSRMSVSSNIASTLMSCPAPADEIERAYLARLPRATKYSITGSVLTIETSGGGGPLVYRAVSAHEAVAGSWVVLNYFRPGAVVSPVVGSKLTAQFADGTISGDSGCNQYTGQYTAQGTSIAIGPLASTLRACADPVVGQQETDYLAALALARTFEVAGGNLTLFRGDGGIAVTFGRA